MSALSGRSAPARFCVALGLCWPGLAWSAKAEDAALSYGRWTVESRGLGWACRLVAVEIRESNRPGEPILVGFERGEDDRPHVWGTSKIDRTATGPSASRWFSGSWRSESATVVVQIRPEATGRLLAIVRERPKDRGVGELVRQVVLGPDPVDGDKLRGKVAARFDSDGTSAAKVALSGVFVAGWPDGEPRAVALPDGFATAAYPVWSPDGLRVAFAGFDAAGRAPLIRVALASGGLSTAVASGTMPTWSRDGSQIAYVASGRDGYATDWATPGRNDERIEAVKLDGPDAGSVEVLARGIWPRWSPVDDRLAFVARADANWDVYLRSSDGLGLARLTDDPALDTQPTWSADGRSIIFLSDRGNRWDLYRVRTEAGTKADRLTDHIRREDNPSPSPDGRHVAFVDNRTGPEGSILVLDLARGTVRPFPAHAYGERDPAWSPDGGSIAFISRRPGSLLPTGGARP